MTLWISRTFFCYSFISTLTIAIVFNIYREKDITDHIIRYIILDKCLKYSYKHTLIHIHIHIHIHTLISKTLPPLLNNFTRRGPMYFMTYNDSTNKDVKESLFIMHAHGNRQNKQIMTIMITIE